MPSFFKRKVYRSKQRLDWVRRMSCMHCGAAPRSEAHHVAFKGDGAMGRKVGDDRTVPLCAGPRGCHRRYHDTGTLPGLTPLITRADFRRELERLDEAWKQRAVASSLTGALSTEGPEPL